MPLEYRVFDPSPCRFPKPRVSLLPRIYTPSDVADQHLVDKDPILLGQSQHFSRGRYALGEAFRLAGLDHTSMLLAPAYHCVTMLDPALALGAEVRLYPLTADLLPDPAAVESLASMPGKPIKVLLATHFFGFVRDFSWLRKWCDERGICFVEDCSHILFTDRFQAQGAGHFGRFVASSPYKFFPCADGGFLWAPGAGRLTGPVPSPVRWSDELRAIMQRLNVACQIGRGQVSLASLGEELAAILANPLELGVDLRLKRAAQSAQYDQAHSHQAALCTSRWIIDHASLNDVIERRRANYLRWFQAVANLPNCRPLYQDLPPGVVPYMFPIYVDFPTPHFYQLKRLAMPLGRWDEMAVSDCPIATKYRSHLLHLPCHQSLSEDELVWMIAALRAVLTTFPEEAGQ